MIIIYIWDYVAVQMILFVNIVELKNHIIEIINMLVDNHVDGLKMENLLWITMYGLIDRHSFDPSIDPPKDQNVKFDRDIHKEFILVFTLKKNLK